MARRNDKEKQEIEKFINLMKSNSFDKLSLTEEETLEFRDAIIHYEEVSNYFFTKFIIPVVYILKAKFDKQYELDKDEIKPDEIRTWLHTGFYDYGEWTRLTSYKAQIPLLNWIVLCGTQILSNELVDLHIIRHTPSPKPSNTNLTLLSMEVKEERRMVVNLVYEERQRELLTNLYVKKMKKEEVMAKMDFKSEESYKKERALAEKTLKECLIRKKKWYHLRRVNDNETVVNLVSKALSTEKSLDALRMDEKICNNIAFNEEANYERISYEDALNEQENWSSKERIVFQERYFLNEQAESLALRLDERRSNIDNIFSRCKKDFEQYSLKRQQCSVWIQPSIRVILEHSRSSNAMQIPKDFIEVDRLCLTPFSEEDILMCKELSDIFGVPSSDKDVMKRLCKCHVASKMDKSLLERSQRPKGDAYCFNSVYVVRATTRDILDELSGFLGSEVPDMDGLLTAAMGLSFLKHLIMNKKDDQENEQEKKKKKKTETKNITNENNDDNRIGDSLAACSDGSNGLPPLPQDKNAKAALADARKQAAALEAKMSEVENAKGVTRNTTMSLATQITRMENNLFLMKSDDSLRTSLTRAVQNMKSILNAQKTPDDTSRALATEIASVENGLDSLKRDEACRRNLSRAVQGMKASLHAEGFEMVDLVGQNYSNEIDASVVFIHDQSLPKGSVMIVSVQRPIIRYKGDRLQSGHVTVGENLPGADI